MIILSKVLLFPGVVIMGQVLPGFPSKCLLFFFFFAKPTEKWQSSSVQ